MPLGEQVINDYQSLSFSLKAHPMSFLRERLARSGCRPNSDLQQIRTGRVVKVSGLVLVRQRPGSAKGVVFETIEDETGVANIIVWPKVFEKFRAIVLGSRCVGVRGKLQNEEGVIHVVAEYLEDLTPMMAQISDMAAEMGGLANADEVRRPIEDMRPRTKPAARIIRLIRDAPELRQDYEELASARAASRALPKGRNFH